MSLQRYYTDAPLRSSASFTRPANVTAYTAGDVVSNDATTTTLMKFADASRINGRGGFITKIELYTDNKAAVAQMRLHLFSASEASVSVVGDNSPAETVYANAPYSLGYIDFDALDVAAGTGSTGAFSSKVITPFEYQCDNADDAIYGFLTDETGGTPTSAQQYTVALTFDRS